MNTLRLVLICSLITGLLTACTKEEPAEFKIPPDLQNPPVDPPLSAEDSLELLRDALLGDYTGTFHGVFNHYFDPTQSYDTTYQRSRHLTPDMVFNGFDVDGSWSILVRMDSTIYQVNNNGYEYPIGRFFQQGDTVGMQYNISMALGHADVTQDFLGYRN